MEPLLPLSVCQRGSMCNPMRVCAPAANVHGVGSSFLAHQILCVNARNILQNLEAFNLGVEPGQVAIVGLTWPALLLIWLMNEATWRISHVGVLTVSTAE